MTTVVDFEAEYADRRMTWTRCALAMPEVGTVVRLRFADALGTYGGNSGDRYYLHDDGAFYLIDPPTRVEAVIAEWCLG